MVKKNKLVLGLTLGALALGCGTFVFAQQSSVDYSPLREAASDSLNETVGLNVRELGQIGGDEVVSVSKTFVQYGVDDLGNYCMRFATAVKGNISSLQYTRKGIEGVKDGQDVVKSVNDVYVGITANDHVFYYDGEAVTTNEAYKGLYYWACYTVSFSNPDYYDTGIEVSLSVDGAEVAKRESSLNEAIENGNPAPTACAITTVANEDVQISVSESALPGAVVEVSLTYDVSAVHVRKVLANDMECGIDGDGNYYFVMPNHDVEISVVSERIAKTKRVTNLNSDVVTLHGVGTQANVGEEVSFTFSIAPGYSFAGEVIVREADAFDPEMAETYEVSYENGAYSFVMPNKDVEVSVSVTKGLYLVKKVDPHGLIYNMYSNGTSIYYGYAEYDSTIKVSFSKNTKVVAKGLRIVETQQEIMIEGSNTYVEFPMPYYGVTVEPIYEIRYRDMNITNTDHLTVVPHAKNEQGEYVALAEPKAVFEDKVYLKVVSEDPETYSLNAIEAKYLKDNSTSTYATTLALTLNEDGYYEFNMPEVREGTALNITITEKNLALFRGYEFVGEYLGLNAYNVTAYTAFNKSYSIKIDTAGLLTRGTNSPRQIASATSKTGYSEITLSDGNKAIYGGNIIFGQYNFSNKTPICNDMVIAIKKLNSTDSDDSYKLYVEMFGGEEYTIITGYKDGELYAAGFIDGENDVAYLEGVEIEMLEGTHVTDTNARYAIKVNGKLLTEVGYTGAGGSANRVLVDPLKGDYTSADGGTLSLDGTSKAVLNGEEYTYDKNSDGQIVLTKGLSSIIVEVDTSNRTFVVVSENIYQPRDELDTRTFTGTCYDEDNSSYTVTLAFLGNGNVEFKISTWMDWVGGSNITDSHRAQSSYVLDKETMTLTINVYLFGGAANIVEMTFSVAEDFNSITYTCGVPGYTAYLLNGVTLTA